MSFALAALIAVVVVAPHRLAHSALPPTTGIALWSGVLALRALIALSLAVIALLYLPATELFGLLTRWCLHAVVPFLATHLGFDGHRLGDAAVLVPVLVIAGFTLSAAFALSRAALAARDWVRRDVLGAGPRGSVIVGGSKVLVAAAGLRAPAWSSRPAPCSSSMTTSWRRASTRMGACVPPPRADRGRGPALRSRLAVPPGERRDGVALFSPRTRRG